MEFRREKDLSIETLRGAAIILVVTGHAIGDGPGYGMGLSGDSFLRHFYFTFLYLRMPLFTVISGWVYALRPAYRSTWKVFNLRKARRLLLPMIFVGAIYYVIQYFVPGTNLKNNLQDMWRLFIFPFTIYWYLPSLFLVFLVISLLDSYGKMDSFRNWLVLLAIAVTILIVKTYVVKESDPNYLSYKGAIYLMPFFLAGIGINRFRSFFSNRYLLIILAFSLVVGLAIQQLSWYHVINYNLKKGTGIGLLIGLSGAVLLLNLKWKVRWLIWIGNFAYTIYLFHAFGTAGARIILRAVGINSIAIIFTVSMLMGIALPILLDYLFKPYNFTRLVFLGRACTANSRKTRLNPVL
ncbi:MAG: acyltransferase [Bacteroidetes bacterium]|nr:acyltransferase [Bacteroidota bacterium]